MGVIALLACTPDSGELDPVALYTRASLDVRGVRPSLAELDALADDPEGLNDAIAALPDDPRFADRVESIWADITLTRVDSWDVSAHDAGVADESAFVQAVGEEPLRFIGRIAAEDRPWTDMVDADWSMADETLASIWPVDYPEGATGWQQVHYTDGRPAAGILGTNGFWWRYTTNESNANRGRANAVSRILLCKDYLDRDILFDRTVDLSDSEAVRNAVATNPGCVACHVSLDPLAAYFYGYFYAFPNNAADHGRWHADRQDLWNVFTGVPPAYYGVPSGDLWHLARQIAADPRFVSCPVEHVWTAMIGSPPDVQDSDALLRHREDFLDGGLTLRSLFRSILTDPKYRAAPDADGTAGVRRFVTPDLLASELEGLTGFRLTQDGWDLIRNDTIGIRTLAGGADGAYVTSNASTPNAMILLAEERLAESAAWHVMETDRADPGSARLFTRIAWDETPDSDPDTMAAQVTDLHRAVLGTPPSDGERDALLGLWSDLYVATGDTGDAWAGVLSALLRDPGFVMY